MNYLLFLSINYSDPFSSAFSSRLLGNPALHAQRATVYGLLLQCLRVPGSTPVILVDWSDAKTDRRFVLLRAALRLRGFALSPAAGL